MTWHAVLPEIAIKEHKFATELHYHHPGLVSDVAVSTSDRHEGWFCTYRYAEARPKLILHWSATIRVYQQVIDLTSLKLLENHLQVGQRHGIARDSVLRR